MTEPAATTRARALATQYGIDLSRVPASRADGVVDADDILAAVRSRQEAAEVARVDLQVDARAGTNVIGRAVAAGPGYQRDLERRIADRDPQLAAPYARAGPGPAVVTPPVQPSRQSWAEQAAVALLTPVERIRLQNPEVHAVATAEGPWPTRYPEGDRPVTLASGLDPSVLAPLRGHWRAEIAAVYAATATEVRQVIDNVLGAGADAGMADLDYADTPRVRDWEAECYSKARGNPTAPQATMTPAEAEALYRRAMAIHEKVLGADHPDVAHSLTLLSLVYSLQRKFGEAEGGLRRALEI